MLYRGLLDSNEWEPAKDKSKSKTKSDAVSREQQAFIAKEFDRKVNDSLKQRDGGSAGDRKETRTCFNCGKKGHIKPNCPELKKSSEKDDKPDNDDKISALTVFHF